MMGHNKGLHCLAWILVIIGGLNWLLVGLFSWDIGAILGGMDSVLARIVYLLVGLAAIYELITHKKTCKACEASSTPAPVKPVGM